MKKIPLGLGKHTIVDDADYDWLNQYLWCISPSGYAIANYGASKLCDISVSPVGSMARLILELSPEDKREADHKNLNKLDNRRQNLRICTHTQNCMNREKRSDWIHSRFKGVKKRLRNKKWPAYIKLNGELKYIGSFSKEKYAAQAYNLAAKRLFGEFALLNKI